MNLRHILYMSAVLMCVSRGASAASFINLDFEQANVPATPPNTFGTISVDPSLAFPGWTVPPNGSTYPTSVGYNTLSLGGPAVILMGPDFPNGPGYDPLQGNYSVLLQYFGIGNPPALSQTGLIPAGTTSIHMLGDAVVEINGTVIPMSNGSGNVSAYAGQTVQLTITTSDNATVNAPVWDYFDDIQFSQVPEPNVVSLAGVCGFFSVWLLKRRAEKQLMS